MPLVEMPLALLNDQIPELHLDRKFLKQAAGLHNQITDNETILARISRVGLSAPTGIRRPRLLPIRNNW